MTASCKICAEVKPRFYKPPEMHVIKATKPMEQLSIDFKGPIKCLTQLFLFGLCSCIHSDRGSAFMSKEFIEFLRGKGIAYSRTSVVNVKSTMT